MGLTKKEALDILKKDAHKYKSFYDFRLNHTKGYCIEKMTRRRGLDLKKVFYFFGGKKGCQLSKRQWSKYLKTYAHKYDNLRLFIDNDPKGSTLKYQMYSLKNIDPNWVLTNFWPNKSSFRELKIVHPAFDKILIKKNILFEKECWISKRSRVDRILTLKNGNKILVELKADDSVHSFVKVASQKSRYHKTAKRKFKKKYCKTYVVSPKGTYGLSFKEFLIDIERFLK